MRRFLGLLALAVCPVLSSSGQTIVVTLKNSNTAALLDARDGKTLATLPTGGGPHEVAVSRDGKWAVVTDYGVAGTDGATLTLIDIAKRSVARTIDLSPDVRPHGAAFLPDGKTVAITAERAGKVLLVDVESGKITGTRVTGQRTGHMVAVSRDGKTGYVANIGSGTLSIVDLAGTTAVVNIPVSQQTEGINLSPDERTVWVGSNTSGKVFVVDVAQRKVIDSVQTSGMPYRVAFTLDSRTAFVTNPAADELRVIDAGTRAIRSVISLVPPGGGPSQPQGMILSPAGDKLWITLGRADQIAEFDIATNKVTRWIPTGSGPDGIAVAR